MTGFAPNGPQLALFEPIRSIRRQLRLLRSRESRSEVADLRANWSALWCARGHAQTTLADPRGRCSVSRRRDRDRRLGRPRYDDGPERSGELKDEAPSPAAGAGSE